MFDAIATLAVAANMRELYRLVLVDTPLAPYFAETLTSEDLDEMNIEILRNTLYKVLVVSVDCWLPSGSQHSSVEECCMLMLVITTSQIASSPLGISHAEHLYAQAYLDDFDKFCSKLGGATAEVMGDLLAFEVHDLLATDHTVLPWLSVHAQFLQSQAAASRFILFHSRIAVHSSIFLSSLHLSG